MATRVNTKFVLILTTTVLVAVAIVGGLWILQIRGDAERHILAGDEIMEEAEAAAAAGDTETEQAQIALALRAYGRAVNKEPSELRYLDKVEQTLVRLRPETQDQANEYFGMRLSILNHRVRYRPNDVEAHLNLINELYQIARWFRQDASWRALADAADEMWERVSRSTPERAYARLYRGLANLRAMGLSATNAAVAGAETQEEVDDAIKDIEYFVEAMPNVDLGRAALVEARLAIARQWTARNQPDRAADAYELADQELRDAVAAVPDGPEVARVNALRMAMQYLLGERDQDDEELAQAVDRMIELVAPSNDPILLSEAGGIVRTVDRTDGLPRAIDLLRRYVEKNPETHYQRFLLSTLYLLNRDLEAAQTHAQAVIDAPAVPVSVLSRIQHVLRIEAASLIGDVRYRQWELAEEKLAALQAMEAARDELARLVAVPEEEPLLVKLNGKIAMARADWPAAADNFERALKLMPAPDFETLWYAARALEQIDEIGLARERLMEALAMRSRSGTVLSEIARLEYRMGLYDDALNTVEVALQFDPENVTAQRLVTAIEMGRTQAEQRAVDPSARALLQAQNAATDGDLDTARDILVAELETAGADRLPLLSELVQIEFRSGRTEQARAYLDEALSLQPGNEFLLKLKAALENDDQIEALKSYMAERYVDEGDRVVNTLIYLQVLAREMNAMVERDEAAGRIERAAETRERAEVAQAEADRFLAEARRVAPTHPGLLNHLFNEALPSDDRAAMQEIVELAKQTPGGADQADGLIFQGRYEMAINDYTAAAQTLTRATERKHYSSLAWRLLGRCHERLGNFPEALAAYEESHRCNPGDAFALRWYVSLLMQTGDSTRALRVLRAARHTAPGDIQLREWRLQLEAEVGDLNVALDERRKRYERAPKDRVNALRLAALLGRAVPGYGQVIDSDGSPTYTVEEWNLMSAEERNAEITAISSEWRAEADGLLDELQAAGDEGIEILALKADLLKMQSQPEAGERLLRDNLKAKPDDLDSHMALAAFLATLKRNNEAVAVLQGARRLQSPDTHQVDRTLADLYFQNDLWQNALDEYAKLVKLQNASEGDLDEDARRVALRYIECLIKVDDHAAAEQQVDQLVARDGQDYFSLMLIATIAQEQADKLYDAGRTAEAGLKDAAMLAALELAEDARPSSPLPHVRRAQRLYAQYERTGDKQYVDDALLALERADQVNAGAESTSRVRIEILRAMETEDGRRAAIGELTRLVSRSPGSVPARRTLIHMLADQQDYTRAIAVCEEGIRLNPAMALWHESKGDVYVLARQGSSAIAAFYEAYRLQPTVGRLAKFAELALSVSNPDFKQITELIGAAPERLDGSPVLRGQYARALLGDGRPAEALDQLRIAYPEHQDLIAVQPDTAAALVNWARLLQDVMRGRGAAAYEQEIRSLAQNKPGAIELVWVARTWVQEDRSEAMLRKALEILEEAEAVVTADDLPTAVQISLDRGQWYVMLRDHASAAAAFEHVHELNPGHPLALNNAAYLYADHLGNPQKGVEYAKIANEGRPNDPFILDTLGWAQFRAGQIEDAETSLRASIKLNPSADNHYHLAHVFNAKAAAAGTIDASEQYEFAMLYLRRAGELRPSSETQQGIDKLTREVALKMRQ